jgi:hypothetical protein
MDEMMGRARFLGRAAVLGAATFATLLAVGTAGVAEAAQTPTAAAATPARSTPHVTRESFILPAGQDSIKVSAGRAKFTVTRPAGASPEYSIGCGLYITDPAYYTGSGGSGVQSTATIRCQYPTTVYLEIDLSFNGSNIAAKGQEFPGVYVASETVTTSAVPGYYQSDAIGISSAGVQYGYIYSNNVYIPQ